MSKINLMSKLGMKELPKYKTDEARALIAAQGLSHTSTIEWAYTPEGYAYWADVTREIAGGARIMEMSARQMTIPDVIQFIKDAHLESRMAPERIQEIIDKLTEIQKDNEA